ncbi:MAG: TonB-dependent receptor [Bacteroidetes bacterium]|nr:TonB-dependent receptor [Bacteroidota bacterium]
MQLRRSGTSGQVGLSVRGQSPVATIIELDGSRLVNAATGSWDLSLIPDMLVDRMELDPGPSGGTSPGGRLRLGTGAQPGVQVRTGMGSWRQRQADLVAAGTRARTHGWTAAWSARTEEGDFPYAHPALLRKPLRHRANADLSTRFLYAGWSASGPFDVTASVLHTRSDRGLPSLSNEDAPGGRQQDEVLLAAVRAERVRTAYGLSLSASMNQGRLDYDPPAGETRHMMSRSAELGLDGRRNVRSMLLQTEQRVMLHWVCTEFEARVADWDSRVTLLSGGHRALFTATVALTGRWRADTAASPGIRFVPALTMLLRSGQYAWLEVGVRRTARNPTINEWFWYPGGNPDLLPESGWEAQVSLGGSSTHRSVAGEGFSWRITFYEARLLDRIVWRPRFQGAALQVWSPYNLGRTHSRGVDVMLSRDTRSGLRVLGSGSWVHIVDRSRKAAASWNRPLPHVAPFMAHLGAEHSIGTWTLGLDLLAQSRRPTSPDGHRYLPSWSQLDAFLQREMQWSDHPVQWRLEARNLLDQRRESSRFMPLPGRHYALSLRFHVRRD